MRQAGGVLRLACIPKRIHDVIVITRLSTLFEIFGCVEHAVSEAAERNPVLSDFSPSDRDLDNLGT